MATQDTNPNTQPEHPHTPNPHEHPQNASGKAGKEISSEQDEPKFDQSSENESLEQQKEHLHEDANESPDETKPRNWSTPETTGSNTQGAQPDEKAPVDRPIKEDGELI